MTISIKNIGEEKREETFMIWSVANFLTFFRIALIPLVIITFFYNTYSSRWIGVSAFFIACVTDFFDGYFARLLKQTTRLGQLLDPIADKLLISSTLFLLAGFGHLSGTTLLPAVVIICRELLISGVREQLSLSQIILPVSYGAKWKTMTQMIAVGIILFADIPGIPSYFQSMGKILLWMAAFLSLSTAIIYLQKSYHLLIISHKRT